MRNGFDEAVSSPPIKLKKGALGASITGLGLDEMLDDEERRREESGSIDTCVLPGEHEMHRKRASETATDTPCRDAYHDALNQNYPTYATAPPEGFWGREVEFLKAQLLVEKRMKQIEDVILFQATSTKPKMEERIGQIEAKVDQLLALGILPDVVTKFPQQQQQEEEAEEEEAEEEEGEQEEENPSFETQRRLSIRMQ
jgi:hypothetical protein